jgi:arsenate reductase (thioredoxin)
MISLSGQVLVAEVVVHHDDLGPLMRRRLVATIDELSVEFQGVFSRGTIERFVEESSDQLGDRPVTGPNFLPLLVGRFARERLRALAQAEGRIEKTKPEVLFVCVRNAGRSQTAAALTHRLSEGWIAVRSAGSQPDERIDPAVIEVMSELGIDVTEEFPKPLTDEVVRAADVVITMGCGDSCPVYSGKHYEDWDVADPAHQPIDVVRAIREDIRRRVAELVAKFTPTATV